MKNKYMLKSKVDFDNLFLNKTSYYSSFYIIFFKKNNLSHPRFAISVSKKNEKKAVNRNKAKRQIKSILRPYSNKQSSFDLLIIVKKQFLKSDFIEKKNQLENLLNKIFCL